MLEHLQGTYPKNKFLPAISLLVGSLFTFPLFKESISTFLFILLSASAVINFLISKPKFNWKILWFTIPFWIVVTDCVLKANSPEDLKAIKNALFFLLFPVLFGLLPSSVFSKKQITIYFEILKNACLIVAIGYIIAFFLKYDYNDLFVYRYGVPKFRIFVYEEIRIFKIHPTYYTSIVLLVTVYCLERFFKEKRYIELVYVFLFFLITLFVLAKINIILMFAVLTYMMLFRSPFSSNQKILTVILIFTTLAASITAVPGIKKRFVEIADNYNKPPLGVEHNSTNIRLAIYQCCRKIAETDYLYGVGFKNIGPRLQTCYEENYDSEFYRIGGYLTHNYYLYIFLSAGIAGILAFMFYIYKLWIISRRINSFLLYVSSLNVMILCLTEDYLYRQYGIFFFSLIFFTFYKYSREKNDSTVNPTTL